VLGSMYNRVGNCNIFFIARVNTSRRSANVIGTPRPNLKFKVSRYRRAADVTARFAAISRMYQERRRNRSRVPPKLPPSRRYSPTLTRNTANLHLLSPSPLPLRPARSTSRFTFSMILPAGCNNARARTRERVIAPDMQIGTEPNSVFHRRGQYYEIVREGAWVNLGHRAQGRIRITNFCKMLLHSRGGVNRYHGD